MSQYANNDILKTSLLDAIALIADPIIDGITYIGDIDRGIRLGMLGNISFTLYRYREDWIIEILQNEGQAGQEEGICRVIYHPHTSSLTRN